MQIYLFFQRKINFQPAAGPIPVVPAVPAQLSGADRAAVECDCISHYRKPEAGPFAFIGRRNPEETLEYLLEILFLHTSPGIVVSDQQLAVGAFVRLDVNHKVPARVLERILHQIPEQRVEQALVAVHAGFGTHEVFDPDPAADYAALQLFKDILKYVPYPDVLFRQHVRSLFHLGNQRDIFDEAGQPQALPVGLLDKRILLGAVHPGV